MRIKFVATTFAIIIMITVTSCSVTPLKINDAMIPTKADGSYPTKDEVKAAIFKGCQSRGWVAQVGEDDVIRASIIVRGIKAEVTIPYSENEFSIVYENFSRKPNYSYYNRWANNLYRSIVKELGVNARGF